ncbi:hypothetical protein KBC04_00535 [Candidatus Babeliales bacterium]|nr:hypothetical protein [Candidatus Babeliales bacterium]MBP9843422.1 hypothetical protein [Candidatus Babeliales bacterium]
MKKNYKILMIGSLIFLSKAIESSQGKNNKNQVGCLGQHSDDRDTPLLEKDSDEPVLCIVDGCEVWFANKATHANFRREQFNRITNQRHKKAEEEKSWLSWLCSKNK